MELSGFISDFDGLPKNVQKHLLEYLNFLKSKYSKTEKNERKFRFDWEGGLSELNENYSSVELQHKANDLR